MLVWMYCSILVGIIFPFLVMPLMIERTLVRKGFRISTLLIWISIFVLTTVIVTAIVNELYGLTFEMMFGQLYNRPIERTIIICASAYTVAVIAVSVTVYAGSLSSKMLVSLIYTLVCVTSNVLIDATYMHISDFTYSPDSLQWSTVFHLIITVIVFVPLSIVLPNRLRLMISRTGGMMRKYLPFPILMFAVFIGDYYLSIFDGGISDLDSHYTYLVAIMCILCLVLLIGNVEGSISVDRYSRELDVAKTIQSSCLPDRELLKNIPSFEIGATMIPAKEVGGDFFDVKVLSDGRVAFVIADVSDKGIPAALFAMRSKTMLDQALAEGLDPSECLRNVNQGLMDGNGSCMFVTMLIGIVNDNGIMTLSCAGHPSPLLYHDGISSELDLARGPILGLMDATYGVTEVGLAPGDVLLFYTDGATDAEDCRGEMFGLDRLRHSFERSTSCDDPVDSISSEILDFSKGMDQSDDLTLISMRYVD